MDNKRKLFLAVSGLAILTSLVFAVLFFYEYANSSPLPGGRYALNFALVFTGTFVLSLLALLGNKYMVGFSAFFLTLALIILTYTDGVDMSSLSSKFNHGRLYYATPHDSTIGVPNFVFIFIWILIILFFIRLAWEYRDKIFVKNEGLNRRLRLSKEKRIDRVTTSLAPGCSLQKSSTSLHARLHSQLFCSLFRLLKRYCGLC